MAQQQLHTYGNAISLEIESMFVSEETNAHKYELLEYYDDERYYSSVVFSLPLL